MIHIFNRISFYWNDRFMDTIDTEHCTGYRRKKFIQFGKLSIWLRQ